MTHSPIVVKMFVKKQIVLQLKNFTTKSVLYDSLHHEGEVSKFILKACKCFIDQKIT